MRADVSVRMGIGANRSMVAKEKIKKNFADVRPKVPGPGRRLG